MVVKKAFLNVERFLGNKTLGLVINAIVHADYATAACDP
jgi:hypothetical protein